MIKCLVRNIIIVLIVVVLLEKVLDEPLRAMISCFFFLSPRIGRDKLVGFKHIDGGQTTKIENENV